VKLCVWLLAILLGSVKVPYEEIRRRIVEFDEENLTSGLIEQLIKYLPSHDQMNQLAALRSQYADLAEPEQFVVVVRVVVFLLHRGSVVCSDLHTCEQFLNLQLV